MRLASHGLWRAAISGCAGVRWIGERRRSTSKGPSSRCTVSDVRSRPSREDVPGGVRPQVGQVRKQCRLVTRPRRTLLRHPVSPAHATRPIRATVVDPEWCVLMRWKRDGSPPYRGSRHCPRCLRKVPHGHDPWSQITSRSGAAQEPRRTHRPCGGRLAVVCRPRPLSLAGAHTTQRRPAQPAVPTAHTACVVRGVHSRQQRWLRRGVHQWTGSVRSGCRSLRVRRSLWVPARTYGVIAPRGIRPPRI